MFGVSDIQISFICVCFLKKITSSTFAIELKQSLENLYKKLHKCRACHQCTQFV